MNERGHDIDTNSLLDHTIRNRTVIDTSDVKIDF